MRRQDVAWPCEKCPCRRCRIGSPSSVQIFQTVTGTLHLDNSSTIQPINLLSTDLSSLLTTIHQSLLPSTTTITLLPLYPFHYLLTLLPLCPCLPTLSSLLSLPLPALPLRLTDPRPLPDTRTLHPSPADPLTLTYPHLPDPAP